MQELLQIIKTLPEVQTLQKRTSGGLPAALLRVAPEARNHMAHLLHLETKRDVFFIYSSEYEARQAADRYGYEDKIFLPAIQTELRPVEAQGMELGQERIAALTRLREKGGVVFLSVDALLQKMRPAELFFAGYFSLKEGDVIPPEALRAQLSKSGYEMATIIEVPGQMAGRGEIHEVFPPGRAHPYRINFFDDEIESIRTFDTDSQRSFGAPLKEIQIPPASEFVLSAAEKEALAAYFSANNSARLEGIRDSYLYQLEERGTFANIEAYAEKLPQKTNILSYGKTPLLLFNSGENILQAYEKKQETQQNMFAEILAEEGAFGVEIEAHFSFAEVVLAAREASIDFEVLQPFSLLKAEEIDFSMRSTVGFMANVDLLVDAIKERLEEDYRIYLCAGGRSKPLSDALLEREITAPIADALEVPGVIIYPFSIEEGFELTEEKIIFYSENDIFGVRHRKRPLRKKSQQIVLLADLKAGDLIVHEVHGKGRFVGLKTMTVAGVSGEYLELSYRDGDKLFIPTAQIGRIDKYIGPDEETARLSKLGGREWETAKKKARASVKELAENLVEIYQERNVREGYRFSEDTIWQHQFEDNFVYEETPGQEESILQIKKDMESTKIMDRLLLGDVGYGKTEVAMRACFKAVMDSKQVAVLVPTTLLARQHYQTFLERFVGFPVRIETLSRYTKKPNEVLENLRTGRTDVVIGTHKLLGKAVKFKDLGLLIIDEEQRFGVSHKERIKDMKRDVDVLTLTATPIPRTLEMAMTGIRDMSTIDTPPDIRKEVQAYVSPFDWGMVRDAVLREMNRGGQIYFVCRRIGEMHSLAAGLRAAVPEARIISAHGRMREEEMESVMTAFLEKEYDILLCTTIIESGIDIPSVNTLIVYEADKFGLAQLYQLKGRIGRSSVRGYAHFTHLAGKTLSETASKRLEAIREFTQFGSGMKIAMRDLEIRGAGNLLGAEQSGHMANVGYSLYVKMMQEEVAKNIGKPVKKEIETSVELGESAYIPDHYISDEALKLDMYRRIMGADTIKNARAVREEFIDRFGPLPREVENLIAAAIIRGYAMRAGIGSVVRIKDTVQLKFAEEVSVNLPKVKTLVDATKGVMLRYASPPFIVFPLKRTREYTEMLQFVDQLKHCISLTHQV
ncbi:MAG: transcription-repair coupling factor [Christensenellaceae bacterium]|jgi:transcription-repair coupling factor (superfamily II helicase)